MPTTMPQLNEKLIACVLEHIENNLDEYNQNKWCHLKDEKEDGEYCGTQACVAGWAVMLSTPVEKWHELKHGPMNTVEMSSFYRREGGRLLGLTYEESGKLFDVASADPRQALKTVKARLQEIRDRRAAIARVEAALNAKGATP